MVFFLGGLGGGGGGSLIGGKKAGYTWVCFFHLMHSLLQMQSQHQRTGLMPTKCQKVRIIWQDK